MLANEGMTKNESFCSATPSAMLFGKSDGDRFAVTRDLSLKPGYVLQFKVFCKQKSLQNIGETVLSQYFQHVTGATVQNKDFLPLRKKMWRT